MSAAERSSAKLAKSPKMYFAEKKRLIRRLWSEQFPCFTSLNANLYVRVNGYVATGFGLRLSEASSRYRIRVFIHICWHFGEETLFFDGYKDYEYSFGGNGIGHPVLGKSISFNEFTSQLKSEGALNDCLSLSNVIIF